MANEIRLGVSACLLGEPVRFDGGHKRNEFLVDLLGNYVTWVAVCPEHEMGLSIPREPLRLEGEAGDPRLVTLHTREDLTERMKVWSAQRLTGLEGEDLDGFVLKNRSPSCGMERVKVYVSGPTSVRRGTGLFARALMDRYPCLPVEEEGRLSDPALREHFVERIFAHRRWQEFRAASPAPNDLIVFHARHKLQLMAHSVEGVRGLGRLVATLGKDPLEEVLAGYEVGYFRILARPTTPRSHTNVLQHMAGYFKKRLDSRARNDLAQVIMDHHQGLIPLVVPVTLLAHYTRVFQESYLLGQTYLEPHPHELKLRNHA